MPDVRSKNSILTQRHSLSYIASRPVWTVHETALVLRCHAATVRREIYRGTLVGVRIGNEWRIPASQFGALTRALRTSQLPEAGDAGRFENSVHSSQAPSPTSHALSPTMASPTTASSTTALLEEPQARKEAWPVLRLQLFGRPRIFIDGVRVPELDSGSRRSQLVELLALHRGGLSADQLACSLEMGNHRCEDERLSTHYVRTLVWGVRQQARDRTGWEGIIESPIKRGSTFHRYQLPDNTVCDLWEFEDRLERADRLVAPAPRGAAFSGPSLAPASQSSPEGYSAPGAADEAAALREEALQLYGGEFCEGSTNGYLVEAARVLEERYKGAALKQADYWRARAESLEGTQAICASPVYTSPAAPGPGETNDSPNCSTCTQVRTIWREALHNYERVLEVDSYHEEACLRAMECCARLGDARSVGVVFNRYRVALEADLLQAPGAAMVRAYEECKALAGRGRGATSGVRTRSSLAHQALKQQMSEGSSCV